MSDRPVIYGPWQRGSWSMPTRILPPPVGEALPVVEVDWNTSAGSEPDWRTDYDPTVQELAAELVRVAKERDRAVKAAAEAGTILEALRLSVIDELASDIVRAIDPTLKLIHAAIGAPDAAKEE